MVRFSETLAMVSMISLVAMSTAQAANSLSIAPVGSSQGFGLSSQNGTSPIGLLGPTRPSGPVSILPPGLTPGAASSSGECIFKDKEGNTVSDTPVASDADIEACKNQCTQTKGNPNILGRLFTCNAAGDSSSTKICVFPYVSQNGECVYPAPTTGSNTPPIGYIGIGPNYGAGATPKRAFAVNCKPTPLPPTSCTAPGGQTGTETDSNEVCDNGTSRILKGQCIVPTPTPTPTPTPIPTPTPAPVAISSCIAQLHAEWGAGGDPFANLPTPTASVVISWALQLSVVVQTMYSNNTTDFSQPYQPYTYKGGFRPEKEADGSYQWLLWPTQNEIKSNLSDGSFKQRFPWISFCNGYSYTGNVKRY